MKTLSVLFTLALLVATNGLAAHLKRVHALPARSATAHSNLHNTESNQ
jgi:hypothetical protein